MSGEWTWAEVVWAASWMGAVVTAPSVLLQRAGRPTAALSWLLALFAIPAIALFAWWLFGRVHLRRKRRLRRRAVQVTTASLRETCEKVLGEDPAPAAVPGVLRRVSNLPRLLQDAVFPPAAGNAVTLLVDGDAVHRAWRELVAAADDHLHLMFYIWRNDNTGRALRDALVDKARQGIEVRVLYDAIGSLRLPRDFFGPVRAAGGKVAAFLPVRLASATPTLNFRNHRKLLISDGRRAYTGGINVGDEHLAWRDVGMVIEGPGVNQLQEVFIDDWFFATGERLSDPKCFCGRPAVQAGAVCETIASGPDQVFNATREMVFLAVTQCRQRLWIATPYFVPDEALLLALRTAVYRGVDVRLQLARLSDSPLVHRASRVFYPELLDAGVRILEYEGMLHAKAMVLDEEDVLIGSANLDTRSFRLNFEVSTFVTDRGVNAALAGFFEALCSQSRAVTGESWQRRGGTARLQDALAHLLSPLL